MHLQIGKYHTESLDVMFPITYSQFNCYLQLSFWVKFVNHWRKFHPPSFIFIRKLNHISFDIHFRCISSIFRTTTNLRIKSVCIILSYFCVLNSRMPFHLCCSQKGRLNAWNNLFCKKIYTNRHCRKIMYL